MKVCQNPPRATRRAGRKYNVLKYASSSRRWTTRSPAHPIHPAKTAPASPGAVSDKLAPSKTALAAPIKAMTQPPVSTASQTRASEGGFAALAFGFAFMCRRPPI